MQRLSPILLGIASGLAGIAILAAQEPNPPLPPVPGIPVPEAPAPAPDPDAGEGFRMGAPKIPMGVRPKRPEGPRKPTGLVEVTGIAATVNGRAITTGELRMALSPIAQQLLAQYPRHGTEFERKLKEARDKILQEMIDRQIILDEYKQMQAQGANIKDHVITEEVKRQIRELYNGDDAKFQDELKRSHMTMDAYRRMTKEKIVVQAMRQQQFADAPPPLPNEVRAEYQAISKEIRDITKDRISFKKIYLPKIDNDNPNATPESQLDLAEDIARQIREGKDFGELAKTHSKDAYAAEGGVQNDVSRMDLYPEFAAIVFDAKEGELVDPIDDRQGYMLVIPTKIVYGPTPPLEGKVREMVEERVHRKKTSAQYDRWIQAKRKKAMINVKIK